MKKSQNPIQQDEDRKKFLDKADGLLIKIDETERLINDDLAKMATEITAIEERHATWNKGMTNLLTALEKQLQKLMKKNSTLIFAGEERVELKNGSLLFTIEERVKKVKGMLETLKQQGFKEAIKIVESVDWDKIETWSAEKLALVGTEKVKKENYSWEMKGNC